MKKVAPPESADAYVSVLRGWRRSAADALRGAVLKTKLFEEKVKWGHLVYFAKGPALLIRVEDERVIFGFWRGKRLREIAPEIEIGGKYEMGRLIYTRGDVVDAALAKRLAVA